MEEKNQGQVLAAAFDDFGAARVDPIDLALMRVQAARLRASFPAGSTLRFVERDRSGEDPHGARCAANGERDGDWEITPGGPPPTVFVGEHYRRIWPGPGISARALDRDWPDDTVVDARDVRPLSPPPRLRSSDPWEGRAYRWRDTDEVWEVERVVEVRGKATRVRVRLGGETKVLTRAYLGQKAHWTRVR